MFRNPAFFCINLSGNEEGWPRVRVALTDTSETETHREKAKWGWGVKPGVSKHIIRRKMKGLRGTIGS